MADEAVGRTGLNLRTIDVPRASELLAGQLRNKILQGELEPGVWLPPERDLAEQSGLSRGSVRDALRVLELEGLVEIKPGRNGGTMIRRPDGSSVVRSLETYIRGGGIRLRSMVEIRELVEPECAALAAERRSEEQIDRLCQLMERMEAQADDFPAFLNTNVLWHVGVADASQNELYAAIMQAISQEIRGATGLDGMDADKVVVAAVKAHRSVIKAIKDRDPDAARRRMARHVHAYRHSVAPQDPAEPLTA